VNLSSEERPTLESMARKCTSPYCDVVRFKIILLAEAKIVVKLQVAKAAKGAVLGVKE